MSKKNLKALTYRQSLATLEDKTDNFLYVINKAKPVGNLNFVVSESGGSKRTIVIKCDTFIPQDLTTQATKEVLLLNPDFKKYYQMGAIEIIDTESAEAEFQVNPKFRAEQSRMMASMTKDDMESIENGITQINAEPVAGAETNVSPFVQQFLADEDSSDTVELIHLLDSRIDSLSLEDVEYLETMSKNVDVITWATENKELLGE